MSRKQQYVRKRVYIPLLIFIFLILGIGLLKGAKYIPTLYQLLFRKEIELKGNKLPGTEEQRVNLLLLGVGGDMHEGPDLTDTIIFTSIDPKQKKATLVSIPRDLWIPDLQAKINTAYTYGEAKQTGGGLLLTKAVVSNLLGQEVHYAFKIDFKGFIKAVDMVGGLDINVERTFDDYQYPLSGKEDESCGHTDDEIASLSAQLASGSANPVESFPCRYEHLHFDKGLQQMDGITSLKFVRSRHALGPEGSDFARSKRQEKVISAFKEKVFSLGTFLNPVRAVSLLEVFKDSIDTNIKEDEYDDFIKLAQKMKEAKVETIPLDIGNEMEERYGLLDSPLPSEEYKHQWVLTPRLGNGMYDEIHTYIACKLMTGNCLIGATGLLTPTPEVTIRVQKNMR